MKINYSEKRLKSNLKFGLFLIIAGTLTIFVSFLVNTDRIRLDAVGVGFTAGGMFYLGLYYYERTKQYLTLKNGLLIKHSLFPEQINLLEIQAFKKSAWDYVIKTDKKEFTIDTKIIDPDSLIHLNRELEKLDLK